MFAGRSERHIIAKATESTEGSRNLTRGVLARLRALAEPPARIAGTREAEARGLPRPDLGRQRPRRHGAQVPHLRPDDC
ncbi:hypothetical protein [Actinopolymorpha pittospori]|uniref:hypothetical protein n=1 Tax=Actinopolymorpha pittospori TaxID=648752 RepID=UPI0031E70C43